MLYFYDTQAGLIATVVLAPLLIGNAIYARKSKRLNGGLNDQVEREVRTLQSGSPFAIDRHFRLLGRWKVALSDAENTAWCVYRICHTVGGFVYFAQFFGCTQRERRDDFCDFIVCVRLLGWLGRRAATD